MSDFKLKNKWDVPSQSLPIIFIGAGGIIRNAHIPAYNKLNLNIDGVYDLNSETAKSLSKDLSALVASSKPFTFILTCIMYLHFLLPLKL